MTTPPPSVISMYEAPFSLYDRTVTAAERAAVGMQRSTGLQATPLSEAFFSAANLEAIQRQLIAAIKQRTGYVIDKQSPEQLLIVMRYVFVQHGRNEGGQAEINRLNALVLREVVPQVGAGLAQYLGYLRDASTMYTPMARGQATSVKGTKSLEVFKGL